MESDSWTARFTSRRHQSTLQSRSDLYLAFEEMDGDDDSRAEFSCPFCSEDFDIVGLCCHIDDEHPVEAKSGKIGVAPTHADMGHIYEIKVVHQVGYCVDAALAQKSARHQVCPVCAVRVGMDMVGHITTQHGQFFKMQRRRRFRRGSSGSHSTLLLRKELREGHLHSLLGGSSCVVPSSSTAPDPLLSSFIYNLPMIDTLKDVESHSTDEGSSSNKNVDEKVVESTEPSLSEKDQEEEEEKARKCEFVQELLLSTFLDDTL